MNIKNLKDKIIVGVLTGCMVLSIGTLPFSQSTVRAASSTITQALEESEERQGLTPFQQLDAKLENLVTTGTITKNLKTNIISYMDQKNAELSKSTNMNEIERQIYITNSPDIAKELVTSGIILQNQINIIEQVLPTVSAPAEDQEEVFGAMTITTAYGNN